VLFNCGITFFIKVGEGLKMLFKYNDLEKRLIYITIILLLYGFYILSPVSKFLGYTEDISPITIVLRICQVVFLFLLFFISVKTDNRRIKFTHIIAIMSVLCIYIMFTYRVFIDSIYSEKFIDDSYLLEYFVFGLLFSLLASILISINSTRELLLEVMVSLKVLLLISTVLIISLFLLDFSSGGLTNIRAGFERLNPISIGRASAVLIIIEMFIPSKHKLLSLLIFIVGSTGLLLSLARGPMLGLAVVLFIFVLGNFSLKKITYLVISLFAIIIIYTSVSQLVGYNVDLIEMFSKVGGSEDQSANQRFSLYISAFEQFSNSPFIGDRAVEINTNYYPHNFLIEVMMSIGAVGLVVFIFINIITIAVYFSSNIILDKILKLVFYLYIFYFVNGMFSGSLFQSKEYWILLLLIFPLASKVNSINDSFSCIRNPSR